MTAAPVRDSRVRDSSGTSDLPDGPPLHVRTAFGVREADPVPRLHLPGPAWTCANLLLRPVSDTVLSAWSSATTEDLAATGVDGLRLARPVRASDGRRVVSGWAACHEVPGEVAPRHDDVVAVSLRLHRATARLPRPRLIDDRDDILARADRMAFGERPATLDPETGGTLFGELARRRLPLTVPAQLVHGDLFGTVLFAPAAHEPGGAGPADPDAGSPTASDAGAATSGESARTAATEPPPAVLDIVPFWRPVEWAAAVVVVDALAWGGADPGLVGRWSHLVAWPQMLLHALLFRLAVHAEHPACTRESLRGLEHAARVVTELL